MSGLVELDQRILAIEHRLVGREERLRQGVRRLKLRVVNEPLRLFGPVLAAAAALGGILWLTRSRRQPRSVSAQPSAGNVATWVHYIGLLWPLLPADWRARISFPWHWRTAPTQETRGSTEQRGAALRPLQDEPMSARTARADPSRR